MMKRKWLAVGIILLFVGTCIVPAIAQNTEKQSSSRGSWLYVGGSGPGNYTKIQDAIDNTTDGGTIYVFPGIYRELIVINNSIQLQGADLLTTLIDGKNASNDIITCVGTNVHISGFTIYNCSKSHSCVLINHTKNCTLYGTRIQTGEYGVTVQNAQNISIINNTFPQTSSTKTGYIAIRLIQSIFCIVSQNTICSWVGGILLSGAHLQITKNTITDAHRGITDLMNALPGTNMYFIIDENHLKNTAEAVFLLGSRDYSITRNEITNSTSCGLHIAEEVFSGTTPENVTIKDNRIIDSAQAMGIWDSRNMSIEGNQIQRNTRGLLLFWCSSTSVTKNTFQDNEQTATYRWVFFPFSGLDYKIPQFDKNFWDKPQVSAYPIIGRWTFFKLNFFLKFPWVTYDWHPAQEPYDIPRMT
jgi:parallel beta-helix repeat protein